MMLNAVTPTGEPMPWYGSALTALTSTYQAVQVNKLNLERAKQGLPPLDPSATAQTLNVGMPPEQLNKILIAGGVALLVVLFVSMRKR